MANNDEQQSDSHDLPPLSIEGKKDILAVKLKAYLLAEQAIQDDPKFTSAAKVARLLDIRNKIVAVQNELSALNKQSNKTVTFEPDTKEPSPIHSDSMLSLVEKILNEYRDQLHNRPEGVPELSIQKVVHRVLKTGVSLGPDIQVLVQGEKLTMPETIGGMPIKAFIAAIEKMNDKERTSRAEAQGREFDDDDLFAEAMAQIAEQQSTESRKETPPIHPQVLPPKKPSEGESSQPFKHRAYQSSRAEAQDKGFDNDDPFAEATEQRAGQQSTERSKELPSILPPKKPSKENSSQLFRHRIYHHDHDDDNLSEEQTKLPKLK